jgi:hypothetical protein
MRHGLAGLHGFVFLSLCFAVRGVVVAQPPNQAPQKHQAAGVQSRHPFWAPQLSWHRAGWAFALRVPNQTCQDMPRPPIEINGVLSRHSICSCFAQSN